MRQEYPICYVLSGLQWVERQTLILRSIHELRKDGLLFGGFSFMVWERFCYSEPSWFTLGRNYLVSSAPSPIEVTGCGLLKSSLFFFSHVWRDEFRGDFAEGVKKLKKWRRQLTKFTPYGFPRGGLADPRLRASNEGLLRPRVARAKGAARLPRLFLRLQQLLPLLEHPKNRL